VKRCGWVNMDNEKYIDYHDNEWGVPEHDDYKLFELLILEGAQAGLSWSTILKKRNNYIKAYDNFDFEKVAKYDDSKRQELLNNEGIVRNRRKIDSSIQNAKVFINIREEYGSFDKYIWSFVDGKPINNEFKKLKDVPAKTELSEKISKDLKKRGMNFVGPTIIYAYMQAIGLVNDHTTDCFRHKEITESEL
jgi:DNA-3-methyladenine glycosylase I